MIAESLKKAGRQVGSPGYSRNLTLPVTRTIEHRPDCCAACRQSFADNTDYRPWNARFELELEIGNAESPKLQIEHSRHDYFSATCPCGHQTRAEPGRGADEDGWSVALSEWHLCGPRLVSFFGLSLIVPTGIAQQNPSLFARLAGNLPQHQHHQSMHS
ncbi:hypothetical protein [Methylotuvimicrobium buryatense]|uniref:hypothetical protein n=1 Tax=Methylotuvimicrobium buryatense TaxID=95641 RepID=UPI001FCC33CD|nr:hypothetical protein [Methylotuvimicrobium buryatense]